MTFIGMQESRLATTASSDQAAIPEINYDCCALAMGWVMGNRGSWQISEVTRVSAFPR
jgi:hypothetical protein